MRLYAIPDIHGRLDLLKKLWGVLQSQHDLDLSTDKVIFLGDMVDRGPDSYGVISFIKELTLLHPQNVIALAGNHEWINIMYFARRMEDDIWLFENNGGPATLLSYQMVGYSAMTQDHLEWLSHLPFMHEEPGFFFSHAPAPRDSYRNIVNRGLELTPDELTWTYHADEKGVARDHGNGVVGVCGHVHALRKGILAPRLYDHYYYLDSGCGCSPKAPLVAVEVKSKEVIYAWP
jgi:hypothetical protein